MMIKLTFKHKALELLYRDQGYRHKKCLEISKDPMLKNVEF